MIDDRGSLRAILRHRVTAAHSRYGEVADEESQVAEGACRRGMVSLRGSGRAEDDGVLPQVCDTGNGKARVVIDLR